MFNRLNTGGINLRPQEIRASLYHSDFFNMLQRINQRADWRRLLKGEEPDLQMKDLEVLLRGFAMLMSSNEYRPSMARFLNRFARKSRGNADDLNAYLENLFASFVSGCVDLPADAFFSSRTKRFSIALYEAVFAVTCEAPLVSKSLVTRAVPPDRVRALDIDPEFVAASEKASADTANVEKRLDRARAILNA
jgi:hypothetical protein